MAEAKRKLKAFIKKHRTCCFCSKNQTETRDHVPPKSVFLSRRFPDEFIFPACKSCNEGTSSYDQIFSIINLAFGFPDNNMPDEDRKRTFRGIINNAPRKFKKSLTEFFTDCKTFDERTGYPAFIINSDLKQILNKIARKFAKALYYMRKGFPLPQNAIVSSILIPNSQFHECNIHRLYELFDCVNISKFNNKYSPQFIYCISKIANNDAYAVLFQIHKACAFLCILSENGIKVATKSPIEWYDMQERIVCSQRRAG